MLRKFFTSKANNKILFSLEAKSYRKICLMFKLYSGSEHDVQGSTLTVAQSPKAT